MNIAHATSRTSNPSHKHATWHWADPATYQGHDVMVEWMGDSISADLAYCREHGHRLVPLDHYNVPTGELYCGHCFALCDDPTYVHDAKSYAYLAWKHWGWRGAGTPRGMRLRYWFHDRLSRLARRWEKGRR